MNVNNESTVFDEVSEEDGLRLPYVKPAILEEERFQTYTLSCTKLRDCATGRLPAS